ncbi:MAG: flippase [Methanomassiliicoccales archaeon]
MSEGRSLIRKTGVIGASNIITSASALILVPILTKSIPVEDYGVWVVFMATVTLVPRVTLFGLPGALARFLPARRDDPKAVRDLFYSSASLVLLAAGSATVLLLLLSGPIASAILKNDILIAQTLAVVVLLEAVVSLIQGYYRAFLKTKTHFMITTSRTVLEIAFVSSFVLLGHGIVGAVLGVLAARVVLIVPTMALVVREIGLERPDLGHLTDLLRFGVPTMPAGLSEWIVKSSDRYLIGFLLGAAFVGYYSPAYTLGDLIVMMVAPIAFVLTPALSRYYDENKMDRVRRTLQKSIRYYLLLAIPAAFGVSLLSETLLEIISTSAIASNAYLITPIVALAAILLGLFKIFSNVIMLIKRTKVIGSIWIAMAGLNLIINFTMIPVVGIVGAALSTLLAYGGAFVLMVFVSSRHIKVSIDHAFILKSVLASVAMSGIIVLWGAQGLTWVLLEILACIGVYFSVLYLVGGIDKEEIRYFASVLR